MNTATIQNEQILTALEKIHVSTKVELLNSLVQIIDELSNGETQAIHDASALRRYVWNNPALFTGGFLAAFTDALDECGYVWL